MNIADFAKKLNKCGKNEKRQNHYQEPSVMCVAQLCGCRVNRILSQGVRIPFIRYL